MLVIFISNPFEAQFKQPESKSINEMDHHDLNTYLKFLKDQVKQ